MLVKFLKTGQLDTVISDDYWGQGENNVDFLQAQFYSNDEKTQYYNTSNYTIECIVKRPDGVISLALVMSSVTLDGIKSAQLSINNWITEVAGELQFTIRLKQTVGGVTTTLVTGLCYRTIGQAIDPADQTITDVQFAALEADIQALDSRLDTAEDDIDDLEAGMLKKVNFYADSYNTAEDLYTAVGARPAIVKSGNDTMLITITSYDASHFYYGALVIQGDTLNDDVKVWSKTGECNKTDAIANVISGIKNNSLYRIQSKKSLDAVLNSYYTKLQTYSKSETNALLDEKVGITELNDYYKKTETYSKVETNGLLNNKANNDAVNGILEKIPVEASSSNKLVDRNLMNDTINSVAAYYVTYDANGNQFPTTYHLFNAQVYYSGGVVRVPTRNDYAIVSSDWSHGYIDSNYTTYTTTSQYVGKYIYAGGVNKTEVTNANKDGLGIIAGTTVAFLNGDNPQTRYTYQNNQWEFQGVDAPSPFSPEQIAAMDSGITQAKVSQYDGYASSKLDKATGITSYYQLYGKKNDGTQQMVNYTYAHDSNTIPLRNSNGNIRVGTPIVSYDAANKQYVDSRALIPTLTQLTDGSYNMDL